MTNREGKVAERLVFLVPGFLGFEELVGLTYFRGVREALEDALARRGVRARVVQTDTSPTGSVRRRAERLLARVIDEGGLEAEELHFVGHSTGGLDVRLLLSPGVRVRPGDTETRIGERTCSVVTLSTPHRGTPLANFFATAYGRVVLNLLARVIRQPTGRLALYLAARALTLLKKEGGGVQALQADPGGMAGGLYRLLTGRIAGWLRPGTDPTWTFLSDVSSDLGLIVQLTPEAMDLYDAAVTDCPGVRYSSLATGVRVPIGAFLGAHAWKPARLARALVFAFVYALTALEHRHYPYPAMPREAQARLTGRVPFPLSGSASDGVVPTLSQVRGRVLDIIEADHLDVIGHFAREEDDLRDIFVSGSGFDAAAFQRVWDTIADAVAFASEHA